MSSTQWEMHNCKCVIIYDYEPEQGDVPALRTGHRHTLKCEFHQALDGKDLHDALCLEQEQIKIVQIKIIELHPEVAKEGSIDPEKVVVGLDDDRNLVAVVTGLDAQEITTLETALKGVCDRDVKVM